MSATPQPQVPGLILFGSFGALLGMLGMSSDELENLHKKAVRDLKSLAE